MPDCIHRSDGRAGPVGIRRQTHRQGTHADRRTSSRRRAQRRSARSRRCRHRAGGNRHPQYFRRKRSAGKKRPVPACQPAARAHQACHHPRPAAVCERRQISRAQARGDRTGIAAVVLRVGRAHRAGALCGRQSRYPRHHEGCLDLEPRHFLRPLRGNQRHQIQFAGHEFPGLGQDPADLPREQRGPYQQHGGLDGSRMCSDRAGLPRLPTRIRAMGRSVP